jgi:hypothetical protein
MAFRLATGRAELPAPVFGLRHEVVGERDLAEVATVVVGHAGLLTAG